MVFPESCVNLPLFEKTPDMSGRVFHGMKYGQ
jgi:hypothetical protein